MKVHAISPIRSETRPARAIASSSSRAQSALRRRSRRTRGCCFPPTPGRLTALPRVSINGRWQEAEALEILLTGAPFSGCGIAVGGSPRDFAGACRLAIIAPMMKPSPDVEIRPAVAADAARIRELTRAAYAKWVALIGREPLPMQADYEQALREHEIDLLTIGGDLAGLIETIVHR